MRVEMRRLAHAFVARKEISRMLPLKKNGKQGLRTPMIVFNSATVTCFARSKVAAT